ncbi:class I SAM-dependent methyltransferase [Paludibacterium yongneupense]|uniref:class I SAM-dependent methyltransferase n=1 Tax=Paludibacterium yongneupense TaxID=400061 RepID=UPI00040D1EFA|nr:class I SAM-dependent methyltransferase [Paludibacterium yongneupense]
MTRRTVALDGALSEYLLQIGLTETPVMRELREFTATHRQAKMQIAPEQGQFLGWLAQLTGVRRYLEIGVFTGYSTLAVAQAMQADGTAVACDITPAFTDIAREYWQRAGVADRIELRLQAALDTLDALLAEGQADSFDLALIDADKPNYRAYFEACLKLVRRGGVIAIDNVFLSGRAMAPQPQDPPGVHLIHAFNAELVRDPRVRLCVLPMGDGMTLATRL